MRKYLMLPMILLAAAADADSTGSAGFSSKTTIRPNGSQASVAGSGEYLTGHVRIDPLFAASKTRLQTMVDRARAEGWEVKGYTRPNTCPRSQISYSLYDVFLGIGARGFQDALINISLPDGSSILQ